MYILQLCSLNNQDPRQKVDVEDDDDDHGNSKEPVAVTLIHPTMKVLRNEEENLTENKKYDVVYLINCSINCIGEYEEKRTEPAKPPKMLYQYFLLEKG